MPEPRGLLRDLSGGAAQFWRGTGVGDYATAGLDSLIQQRPYSQSLAAQRALENDFAQAHPKLAPWLRGAGNVIPSLAAVATGGLLAPEAAAAEAAGSSGLLDNLLGPAAKQAATGAAKALMKRTPAPPSTPDYPTPDQVQPFGSDIGAAKPTPGQPGDLIQPANNEIDEGSAYRAASALSKGDTLQAMKHLDPQHHTRALDDLTVAIDEFARKHGIDNHPTIEKLGGEALDLSDALEGHPGVGSPELHGMRMDRYFKRIARDHPEVMQQIAHDWNNELLSPGNSVRTPSGLE